MTSDRGRWMSPQEQIEQQQEWVTYLQQRSGQVSDEGLPEAEQRLVGLTTKYTCGELKPVWTADEW